MSSYSVRWGWQLDSAERLAERFQLVPRRRARGKRIEIRLTASAAGLGSERASATLKVKRR